MRRYVCLHFLNELSRRVHIVEENGCFMRTVYDLLRQSLISIFVLDWAIENDEQVELLAERKHLH